ncbi:hypothetical protein J6590_022933 [Homalodisca vitripennis]|nr:hypothetical protein J6590_022933 [Homalodisca vitripennis]
MGKHTSGQRAFYRKRGVSRCERKSFPARHQTADNHTPIDFTLLNAIANRFITHHSSDTERYERRVGLERHSAIISEVSSCLGKVYKEERLKIHITRGRLHIPHFTTSEFPPPNDRGGREEASFFWTIVSQAANRREGCSERSF